MAAERDKVILVNEQNEWLGMMDKIAAHKEGLLHRAISVFIVNEQNELLMQQRADAKYHSGGLWSNACCSHPMQAESSDSAAHRRLKEELGFDCELSPAFILRYKAEMDNGLIENEYDHIYFGIHSGPITINTAEVKAYRYIAVEDLLVWVQKEPNLFTEWFRIALPKFLEYFNTVKDNLANPGTRNNLYQ